MNTENAVGTKVVYGSYEGFQGYEGIITSVYDKEHELVEVRLGRSGTICTSLSTLKIK